jgi:hypothetical protein
VDIASFDDRQNPDPIIYLPVDVAEPTIGVKMPDRPDVPEPPATVLYASDPPQKYYVELWCEKSTCRGELSTIAERYKLNVQLAKGEISLTACRNMLQRALASRRPVRILYLSDFDPGGQSMPVAAARKLEWLISEQEAKLDVQLLPILLDHDQCVRYRLPRIPIKETERRAARFEERFGDGATELDALMAIHSGELERIVEREVLRYYDSTLSDRFDRASRDVLRELALVDHAVHSRHAESIQSLQERYAELNEEAELLFETIAEELREQTIGISCPFAEAAAGDEAADPLFDARRDYVAQIDRYRSHQGKAQL